MLSNSCSDIEVIIRNKRPSRGIFVVDIDLLLKWNNNDYRYDKLYYSKVWERTADMLGGVNRKNYYDFWDIRKFIFW